MDSQSVVKIYDGSEQDTFPRYLIKVIRELRQYRFALSNFVINNLRMRYRRSSLGFLWSLLNPLLVMTVISVVFSIIFQQDLKSYSVYIFSGLAPWWFISAAIIGGCSTLINAEGFLKKVYIPKALFPVVSVTTEAANFIFSIISLYILALLLGFQISWTIVLLPLAITLAYFFTLGWALIVGVVTVYFRDLSQILVVVFQALFYMVPIVYPLTAIPEELRFLFLLNPFYYYIMLFRKVIYGSPSLTASDWIITFLLSAISLLFGIYVLMKQDRDLIYRL